MGYRAGIAGGSGYSGAELLRLLAAHPDIDVEVATSREFAGRPIAGVYPNLGAFGDLAFETLDPARLESCDVVFLALPHGASMEIGARLASAGVRVVDFSADFRLQDPRAYPDWFGAPHSAPDSLSAWAYGLPELNREAIGAARLVANPGCYPTAALLALAPLVRAGAVDASRIVVSAASGTSGAGRAVGAGVHFSHVDANFKAYGAPRHKHTPEIEQELTRLGGAPARVTFVPHLLPTARGLLATCIAPLTSDAGAATVRATAAAYYEGEPFVRVLDTLPETKYTAGSNLCLLGYEADERAGTAVAIAALDNLGKGAAGQALQNANILLGLPETTGLSVQGIYP